MGEIEFIFQVKDYDAEALVPQVSKALKRRMELRSQQLRPGKPNPAEMTEEQRKKARIMDIISGIVMLVLGVILLVSGYRKGEGNTWTLVIGAVVAFLGLKRLIPQRKPSANTEKYDKAAREFLAGHKENLEGGEVQICFSDEEMIIVNGAIEDLDQEAVTYDEVEFAMETEDIFLLVHGGRGVMLQKKDITLGTAAEFRDYIGAHVKSFTPYEDDDAEGVQAPAAEPDAAEKIEITEEVETAEAVEATEETDE